MLDNIDIINDCGNWYAIVTGYFSSVHTLDFGNSILNSLPIIIDIGGITEALTPRIVKDIDQFFVFVTRDIDGELIRLDFGSNLGNTNPTMTNLGNLGQLDRVSGFDMYQENLVIKGLGIGIGDRKLTLTEFPRTCGSTIES